MGLRLVAHYFDREEALVAHSAVNAAGMLSFLPNFDALTALPYYTLAFGGYRLLVVEEDLEAAVSVLREARLNPLVEGEGLIVETDLLDRVLGLLIWLFAAGAPAPVKHRRWREHALAP
jgi:hypothetical protein